MRPRWRENWPFSMKVAMVSCSSRWPPRSISMMDGVALAASAGGSTRKPSRSAGNMVLLKVPTYSTGASGSSPCMAAMGSPWWRNSLS